MDFILSSKGWKRTKIYIYIYLYIYVYIFIYNIFIYNIYITIYIKVNNINEV